MGNCVPKKKLEIYVNQDIIPSRPSRPSRPSTPPTPSISPVSFISKCYRLKDIEYHEKIKKILIEEYKNKNKNKIILPTYSYSYIYNLNYIKKIREIFLVEYRKQHIFYSSVLCIQ